MSYEMLIMIKPYVCTKCACLFCAPTHPGQGSTLEPCPFCGVNNGNMRADKSGMEVAREHNSIVQDKHDAQRKLIERHGGADEYFDDVLQRQKKDEVLHELDIGCADELAEEHAVPPELEMCYAGEE